MKTFKQLLRFHKMWMDTHEQFRCKLDLEAQIEVEKFDSGRSIEYSEAHIEEKLTNEILSHLLVDNSERVTDLLNRLGQAYSNKDEAKISEITKAIIQISSRQLVE